MIPWSLSRLQNFGCPAKFNMLYIDKSIQSKGSDAANYGNWVHEWFAAYVGGGHELPADLKQYQSMLDQFRDAPGDTLVEYEMCINPLWEFVDWWADDAWFRIKLDVTVVNGDTALYVDYKTGTLRYADDRQLSLSAALIMHRFPEVNTVHNAFLSLKDQRCSERITYTREDNLEFLLNWMASCYAPILTALHSSHFPFNPSKNNCIFCPANPKNGGDCSKAV